MISKRYAHAFLNVFPLLLIVLNALNKLTTFLDQHDEVFLMLKIPLLDASKKAQALEDYLIERFKLPESFKRLIAVLIDKKDHF